LKGRVGPNSRVTSSVGLREYGGGDSSVSSSVRRVAIETGEKIRGDGGNTQIQKFTQMPIAPFRSRDGRDGRTKIERIYISQDPFPFPSLASKSLLVDHGQKKDRNSTYYRSSLSLFTLSPHPQSFSLFLQHERNRSVTFLKVSFIHPLSSIFVSPPFSEEERPLQKGVRTRRPLLCGRRSHRL
jgi:hypothetical protein